MQLWKPEVKLGQMNLCTPRMLSKLPRGLLTLEGSQLTTFHKLSCLVSADYTRLLSSSFNFKDFRFITLAKLHTNINNTAAAYPVLLNTSTPFEKQTVLVCNRRYNSSDKDGEKKSLVQSRESPYAHLTVGQKVKEAGKDVTYIAVIIAGIAVTGLMFYMIGSELFSSQSPSGVFGDALKKCQNSLEISAALGEPIKGYGETTRRGRRRHVSHTEFEVKGIPHMRMKFYIEGPYKKATVHVEVQKADSGKYEYRYLFVETEGYPHRTFLLEDNREMTEHV